MVVAHKIADKLEVLASRSPEEVVLAIRQVQYPTRQEVMVVDDVATALAALRGQE